MHALLQHMLFRFWNKSSWSTRKQNMVIRLLYLTSIFATTS